MHDDRHERGLEFLNRIDGSQGEKVMAALASVAPDLGRMIVDFGFGEVISRPGLDLRTRELCTIAMLAALGTARPQLVVHLNACLNVGATPREMVEALIQCGVYAGFPAALNALFAADEVFKERGVSPLDGQAPGQG